MSANKKSFIWTSYSDLMTSLFFVMLVLFVLVIAMLHKKLVATNERERATQAQLDKITELNNSIQNIDSEYFEYNKEFKRHTMKNISISFPSGSSDMSAISLDDKVKLRCAGEAIVRFMISAQKNIPNADYLLIVEGQSSNDGYAKNYELSYERALALVKFWSARGIIFDNLPCEVIISGSGRASKFREKPDNRDNHRNQRFVIHIIPKPGIIE